MSGYDGLCLEDKKGNRVSINSLGQIWVTPKKGMQRSLTFQELCDLLEERDKMEGR